MTVETAVTRFAIKPSVPLLAGDLPVLPPVPVLVAVPAVFRGMEREDRVPVLQPVERRDRVPVMEVQDIKFFLPVELVELLHHLVAHVLAVLHRIATLRPAVMVLRRH